MLIVYAEEVRPSDIDKLETLIDQHHSLFQELYVNEDTNVFEELSDSESEDWVVAVI